MSNPLIVGSTLHAFVAEGATVVWSDAMRGLNQNFGHELGVMALHSHILRDGFDQPMEGDQNYVRFADAGIPIIGLDRTDAGNGHLDGYTQEDLDRLTTFVGKSNILTALEERPVGVLVDHVDREPSTELIVNLYRSGENRTDEEISVLKGWLDSGAVAKLTVDADASRDAYVRKGIPYDSITVIHNGIDINRFKPSEVDRANIRKELNIPSDAPTILLVGRDSPEKGIPLFVQSAKIFLENNPNGHVIMAGAGLSLDNKNIADLLGKEGIGENSELRERFHAVGPHSDLPRYHAASDVLAVTSVTESRTLTISEAQAAGLGVTVSTDVGDCAVMIDGHGFITGRNPIEIAARWQEAYDKREELKFPLDRRNELGTSRMIAEYNNLLLEVAA